METISKLEVTIASWYKGLPHLPEGARKWIANNVWWLVLIGVILSLMVLIPAFSVLFFSNAVITAYGAPSDYYGAAFIPALLSLIILVADLVLSILAISPLKAQHKRGWTLLFMTMLLGVLSAVLSLLASQQFGSFISGIIGTAIGGYFLFEIRDRFSLVGAKTVKSAASGETSAQKKA
jgi:hypothetical protein